MFRRRFLFNALLPTLVFATLLAAVVVTSVGSLRELGGWWAGLDVVSKAVAVLTYVATVWFLAVAVASQWRGIVRLFEGYPAIRLLRGHVPGIAAHTARQRRLWNGTEDVGAEPDPDAAQPEVAYWRYPLPEDGDDVLPTTLGNILLAGERYAVSRYGMDTIYFWPRLFPLLPERFQAEYEEFVVNYEFPLVVAFEAMVVATLGGGTVLLTGGSPLLFVLWFGGGNALAYAFYVLSFSSAEELAEQQRTAFDLYRHLLLEQWPTPADVRDEKAAFTEIEDFIIWKAVSRGECTTGLTWDPREGSHRAVAGRREAYPMRGPAYEPSPQVTPVVHSLSDLKEPAPELGSTSVTAPPTAPP
ncbi:MAG TPA: hypothetical protein VFQ77_06010 [Pseudonocardiaceae bacterium]|nr:hypothetical protein [Pseudonocardiaceae bacterium]